MQQNENVTQTDGFKQLKPNILNFLDSKLSEPDGFEAKSVEEHLLWTDSEEKLVCPAAPKLKGRSV